MPTIVPKASDIVRERVSRIEVPMAERRTFSDEETRVEARRLYDLGMGCNAIGREIGIVPSAVSAWAKREGLKFDRSKVIAANKANAADLEQKRLRLVSKMADVAEDALDSLDAPYLVYNFGGKDNEYRDEVLDAAPMDARRTAVTMAGIAFDKASRVIERETDVSGATSVLGALQAGLGAVVAALDQDTPPDEQDG
ncbi:hypothetical protein [Mycetocola spongiae]|uniref:hypothetical protein n=1 Tax=Mycetocola spongiae TaxID=2859226 RepID=UPI001CF40BD3|nr:hypothetical protein [Mycetocola spongiae]UCR89258.1 hypothetical protein KXZ72_00650 [Mycetocola spongiae]